MRIIYFIYLNSWIPNYLPFGAIHIESGYQLPINLLFQTKPPINGISVRDTVDSLES